MKCELVVKVTVEECLTREELLGAFTFTIMRARKYLKPHRLVHQSGFSPMLLFCRLDHVFGFFNLKMLEKVVLMALVFFNPFFGSSFSLKFIIRIG